ncbi:GAF domain-containing protein [Pseudanabaena sp. FACHB-1998]|uniref:GAF domain-containing protein n=1 Tax=Pseudanabaena sp. FACHB-1998 TaxID=2692858 RepID=UPI001680EC09|nr:GAF domain-containing protein [Pseudanabaena sp. FACHB-1998]MBD2176888.1 GAF domain-containing protein [Pseudanabaena sp. FACHB-1998]
MMHTSNHGLSLILSRITNKLQQDVVVSDTLHELRDVINVDRVVLYYFYTHWKGQVTFESLSDHKYSIIGSMGADDCFNLEYAELYLAGRINSTDDIETASISDCHRNFLRTIQVRSNLVAPVLTNGKLWGLLVAHQCQHVKNWQSSDIEAIHQYSVSLATASSAIKETLEY